MKHLKAIHKYFWKYRFRFSVGIFFVLISNYFNVLTPQITGFVIEFVQRSLNLPGYVPPTKRADYDPLVEAFIAWMGDGYSITKVVMLCGIVILALALLRGIFLFLMRQTLIVMSRHIEFDQKNEIFQHYQRLDMAFYKRNSTGDLMNRITEDVSRVRMYTGPAIMYLVNLIAIIGMAVYFMLKRDELLTLYVLAPLPILALIIYFVNNSINRKSERIQEALSDLTTNAQESYSGIRVIKSFVQERAMLGFFQKNSEHYRRSAISLAKLEAIYFPSITLLIGISTLLTIMIGGLYYINGSHGIDLATIVEFVMYINMLTFPVSAIGFTASMIQRAAASQKRINEFLMIEPEIRNQTVPVEKHLAGDIIFKDVRFTYPDTGITALKDFNLHIVPGEKIAVIGRTGSGKTTMAHLLLRMQDVSSGAVEFDGVDVRNLSLVSLRDQIAYVPQDGFLFSDTVFNNVAFGEPDATEEAVLEATRLARVQHDIQGFSEGYQTMIGERGVTLSGGQKQRISIARAIIKKPSILLFDDCLSAVDARTEQEITANLNTYLEGRTAIIITHRIFSQFEFDRIIVLDDGQISEQGTHAQLLAKNGYYASLYARQLDADDSEENEPKRSSDSE